MLHFNDLKRDLPGEVVRLAAFLDIGLDDRALARVTAHSSFEYMKANAGRFAPRGGTALHGGATSFLHKGTNGRWREMLTPADIARYEAMAERELGLDCAHWLAEGGPIRS